MNFYKYQRSKSFTDLCSGCLRFSTFKFFYKTAELRESKLHVEPIWDVGITVCAWFQGPMNKMATIPRYIVKNKI